MPASRFFWNLIADRYSRSPVEDEVSYRRKLQMTQDFLRPGMRVLEFGCGTGSTALLHAPLVGVFDAVDFSWKMIEIARKKVQEGGVGNVRFECAAVEDFQAESGSYDVILGMSVLHLLEDWSAILLKVRRLLKPGGVFISSTPCLRDSRPFFRYIAPVGYFFRILPLVRVFGVGELRQAFVDTDFVIRQQWEPGRGKAVFFIVEVPEAP